LKNRELTSSQPLGNPEALYFIKKLRSSPVHEPAVSSPHCYTPFL
jgi:hypothetical protein